MAREGSGRAPIPAVSGAHERLSRTLALGADVSRVRYASGKRLETLRRLGFSRVRDLLSNVPHRYLDFTCVTSISHADVGSDVTVVARVEGVRTKRPRPRMAIVEVDAVDATGVMTMAFFRQPWVADQLHVGDVAAFSGKVRFAYGFKQMTSPFFEVLSEAAQQGSYARILPVHPTGEGMSLAWMRRVISSALESLGDVCDFLPAWLVARRGLMTLPCALREVHFPHSLDSAREARRRLAYDELLCLQLALATRRRLASSGVEPHVHVGAGEHLSALRQALPFALTEEQEACVADILGDMASPRIMNRLLLGDVGTGKTAVAAFGLAAAADSGFQAAVMAPTSVLARQYAEKVGPLLDGAGVSWRLILGSTPAAERAEATAGLASGEVSVAFGTTALLSDDVSFRDLSLVVIDEQHRFGVDQRVALRRKGAGADLLAMTATPIPRTLALSLYGDLDCSRIRRRPVAGAGVSTRTVTPQTIEVAYRGIREAVDAGHQAYVICPLIDEDDSGQDMADDAVAAEGEEAAALHSAIATERYLAETIFPEYRVGLLTGRMGAAEKDEVMEAFRSGAIQVLVSTTVVEVGVDVPNSTAMLVHDADRFGLATLHQLRGRVGRGQWPGMVFLESRAKKDSPARRRLSALEATTDGFELAELDLDLRHEGEVLGYRQSGGATLRIVDLAEDADLVEFAHADSRELCEADPDLAGPQMAALAHEMRERFGAYFEEVERA